MARTPVIYGPHPNSDEKELVKPARYVGNFHKTLPHNSFGEVDVKAFEEFVAICNYDRHDGDFEYAKGGDPAGAKLNNPQAGRATDTSGPDPLHMDMQPAPGVLSESTAAEMTELYWMALLRDLPFEKWSGNAEVNAAIKELSDTFTRGLGDTRDIGRLQLGTDLPGKANKIDLRLETLFRGGLPNEEVGPLVSQFFLQDFNYGAQFIAQTVFPYKAGKNYLTTYPDWLRAQNTGYDKFHNDYGSDNNFTDDPGAYESPPVRVHIRNMRDIARFVNRDALHQAYFNAALQLINWGVKFNDGNPYNKYKRQAAFGTLGGPNILALVSEVASRALKVVWRQKWLVHRRLRPEVYGGLMQVQMNGLDGSKQNYGLPGWVFTSDAANRIAAGADKTYYLPIAYSAGSPPHPSYGAGHATVAGACVTILKAWFQDPRLADIIDNLQPGKKPGPGKDPGSPPQILQPGSNSPTLPLQPYTGVDRSSMTVHGELNKLAANVAMGRSMGGVHWRSDNTRSLRLGERIATIILRRLLPTYAERPLELSYVNFDNDKVSIDSSGKVTVVGDDALTEFYSRS